MYKLLTTAAVIMAVATPSVANEWTGAADLTNKLNNIYTNLDGGTEFKALEGDFSGNDGQLGEFFSEVDKGVTHVTLTVDPVTNNISTAVVGGTTFGDIQTAQTNLVNRVNFDLFVQDSGNADTSIQTFDEGATYAKASGFQIDGDSSNTAANDYSNVTTQGLAGRKIDKLVGQVNAANDYLLEDGRTNVESKLFTDTFNKVVTGNQVFGGADISVIDGHILGLNNAINAGRDTVGNGIDPVDPGDFFGNIGLGGLAEDNVNQFLIPAFNSPSDIGAAGDGGYSSISNWAAGVQTVEVDGTSYTITTGETLTIEGTQVKIGTATAVDPTVANGFNPV